LSSSKTGSRRQGNLDRQITVCFIVLTSFRAGGFADSKVQNRPISGCADECFHKETLRQGIRADMNPSSSDDEAHSSGSNYRQQITQ